MSSSKPCPSKNKIFSNKYLVPAKTHYDYLLTFRKHITKIYGIEESDKRLKYLIKFENKPIVYTSSSNKELQNYETKLVDFMRECDPDLFTNIAKQFKTKYGYEWVSQFTTRGEVKQSLFWDKLKTHWDQQREALRKIKEEKKMEKERERQRKVEEEKIEEEIKTAEDKLGQKYKQAQIIDDVKKKIQDFVYKCCNQSQTDWVDSMLNWWKAYLFV